MRPTGASPAGVCRREHLPHTQYRPQLRPAGFLLGTLMTALMLWQPAPAGAKPGDLDPTFGTGGRTSTPNSLRHSPADLEIDRDGRILVAFAAGDQAGVFRFNSLGQSLGVVSTRQFTRT